MIDFSKYTLPELRAIGEVMDDLTSKEVELESWQFACYFRSTAREAFRAESAAIDQQARDHAAAEAEKVDQFKQALYSSGKVQLSSLYGTCVTDDAPPAEEPDRKFNVQALVDGLSWCSDCLAALADLEDVHFAECGLVDVYNKVILLRGGSRAVSNLLADIRDHYDGLH